MLGYLGVATVTCFFSDAQSKQTNRYEKGKVNVAKWWYLVNLDQRVSVIGDFAPARIHLAMFADTAGCYISVGEGVLFTLSECQGCCQVPYEAEDSPHHKEVSTQNAILPRLRNPELHKGGCSLQQAFNSCVDLKTFEIKSWEYQYLVITYGGK